MKSFAILALSAVALAAPIMEKRDVVYETVVENVYETVYTTTTVWVDPTPAPASTAAAFYEQPWGPKAAATSSAAPAASPYTPPAAPQVQPQQAAPVASSSAAPYVAPVAAPSSPAAAAPAPVAPSPAPVAPAPETPAQAAPVPTYTPPAAPAASSAAPASSGSNSGGQGDHTGDITFYDVSVGTGSCGTTASNSDNVVALSHLDMNNGANPNANPLCGKMINIYYNGGVHQARVFDTCPTCAKGSLDLTESLFNAVAPGGDGRVHGVSWSFA